MTDRSELHDQALHLDQYRCAWAGCYITSNLQMAHLRGVGMGGRPSADVISNVAMLCPAHHDLLDGRAHAGLRRELGTLLAAWVRTQRRGQL